MFRAIIFLSIVLSMINCLQIQQNSITPTSIRGNKRLKLQKLQMNPFDDPVDMTKAVTDVADYVFVPPEMTNELYLGAIIATLPFIWASNSFGSRLLVQRDCLVCTGSGLVYVTRQGNPLTRARKCWSCGGFLPWLGWKMFFFSSFFDVGNGGALQRPSKDYEATNEAIRKGELDYSIGQKQAAEDEEKNKYKD